LLGWFKRAGRAPRVATLPIQSGSVRAGGEVMMAPIMAVPITAAS
jgi:hypothetical protein